MYWGTTLTLLVMYLNDLYDLYLLINNTSEYLTLVLLIFYF